MPLRTLTLASVSSLLCVLAALPLRAETVTLTTGPDEPPFTDRNRPDGGTATRLVLAVFRAMGVETKLDWLPWRRGYNLTKNGIYRASFPYLRTSDREPDFLFSDTLYSAETYLWTRAGDSLTASDPAGFAHRSICVPQGYHSPLMVVLEGMIERGEVQVERPDTPRKCVQMLAAGRIDALSGQEVEINLHAEAEGVAGKITRSASPLMHVDFHVVFSRQGVDNQPLLERFNQALQKMKDDGSYAEVMSR